MEVRDRETPSGLETRQDSASTDRMKEKPRVLQRDVSKCFAVGANYFFVCLGKCVVRKRSSTLLSQSVSVCRHNG